MIIYILLVILYVIVGAFAGYFVFDEEEYGLTGPMLGIVSWPLLLIALICYLINLGVYKFVKGTVHFFKRIKKVKRKKSKDSLDASIEDWKVRNGYKGYKGYKEYK